MDEVCRLCAEKSLSLKSIFTIINNRLLLDMIALICPIKVEVNDNFSKQICALCLRIVIDANNLRIKSVQSEMKFKSDEFSPANLLPRTLVTPELVRVKQETENCSNILMSLTGSCDDEQEQQQEPYDDEMQQEDSNESDEWQPKRLKIHSVQSLETRSRISFEKALNEKVKNYFEPPDKKEKRGKWLCKICKKSYAGEMIFE